MYNPQMNIEQQSNQPVNITEWRKNEEYAQYPEGARDKTLLYSPDPPPYPFLKPKHLYLFKLSASRGAEQFWVEIFAYRLGLKMGIPVPPAFAAYDTNTKQVGVLIEWFFSSPAEDYTAGGDYCQEHIPTFDRKKGKQHNFELVSEIFKNLSCSDDWLSYWAKTLLFDALIGNNDRHQDNWGTIETIAYTEAKRSVVFRRIAPVFDNGSSMGYEILSSQFKTKNIAKYVAHGHHHMKWKLEDPKPMEHSEMISKIVETYPETRSIMINCLKNVSPEIFKQILDELVNFDVPIKLTQERSVFMLNLLQFRYQELLNVLEN